jgi:chromate reductase, NAD(P)H dehydrogenase (quinone)
MTRLLGISGSLRKASTNTGLLRSLKEMVPAHIEFDIATLHGIPLYDGDEEEAHGKPEAVKALDARIRTVDGVVFACPEYNFSVPGVLKNATDWLSRGSAFLKWKRVGIVGAGDGVYLGSGRSQYHFRQTLQALQAIIMPRPEIFVNHNSEKFDHDGNLTDAETRRYLEKWLTAFVDWVEKRP